MSRPAPSSRLDLEFASYRDCERYWRRKAAEWSESHLSLEEFAEREDLNPLELETWSHVVRREAEEERLERERAQSGSSTERLDRSKKEIRAHSSGTRRQSSVALLVTLVASLGLLGYAWRLSRGVHAESIAPAAMESRPGQRSVAWASSGTIDGTPAESIAPLSWGASIRELLDQVGSGEYESWNEAFTGHALISPQANRHLLRETDLSTLRLENRSPTRVIIEIARSLEALEDDPGPGSHLRVRLVATPRGWRVERVEVFTPREVRAPPTDDPTSDEE